MQHISYKTRRRRPLVAFFLAALSSITFVQESAAASAKNLAQYKKVSASTLHPEYSADPAITVDGTSGYGSGAEPLCLVTESEENPWMCESIIVSPNVEFSIFIDFGKVCNFVSGFN